MFIERRINPTTGLVELWKCQWVNRPGSKARKEYLAKICDEQNAAAAHESTATGTQAICWSWGRSLGNIAVRSSETLGRFPSTSGEDARLPCNFINAGKFRHGPERWWCQTHQTHWGTKADLQSLTNMGEMRCANHAQLMSYVLTPEVVDLGAHAEVGLWCSMPAAISSSPIEPRAPKLHMHIREVAGESKKTEDRDLDAVSVVYGDHADLFGSKNITRVDISPPAAFEFVCGLEEGRNMTCINCVHCGYPHLDLGDFARQPHRKHFCGNCGRDNTISSTPIVSTPLQPLNELFSHKPRFEVPDRTLDLDKFSDCNYTIWASTPAIIWTAKRPQEVGLHVHVERGGLRIEDNTFASVTLNGVALDRKRMFELMVQRSVVR
jgi:hypothetical protein